jgi:hypothetical protein
VCHPALRDRAFLSERFFFVTVRLRKRRRQLDDADFQSLAMVQRERVFRRERGATNAPLRVNDYQFALGFESAKLRKNRRPQRRRSELRLLPSPNRRESRGAILAPIRRGRIGVWWNLATE